MSAVPILQLKEGIQQLHISFLINVALQLHSRISKMVTISAVQNYLKKCCFTLLQTIVKARTKKSCGIADLQNRISALLHSQRGLGAIQVPF
jgi:hypothetical protein